MGRVPQGKEREQRKGLGGARTRLGACLPSAPAGGKGSGVAGCGDVGVRGPVLP